MYEFIISIAAFAFGGCFGYFLKREQPDVEQIHKYMSRIVNMEAMEEHEKLVKVRMARNKVKTTRVDSGPNARVMRMRVRRRNRK